MGGKTISPEDVRDDLSLKRKANALRKSMLDALLRREETEEGFLSETSIFSILS